jgi:hypothetical protein
MPGQNSAAAKLRGEEGHWRLRRIKQYLIQVDRFLSLLLAAIHITSGQPSRGTEITSIRHANGLVQDRNIYVINGQVITVTRYHKSQSQWDKPRVVPRFLPPRLGQVLVIYLAYALPFQEFLKVEVLKQGMLSDYIWLDKKGDIWETERLTRALQTLSKRVLGTQLGTASYRHTAVGIGREKVSKSFGAGIPIGNNEEEEEEVDLEDNTRGQDPIEL